jgi:hypothetical protein
MHTINFILNSCEHFSIEIDDPLDHIGCCYNGRTYFVVDNNKIFLSGDTVDENMYRLSTQLTKALQNQLPLESSLQKNIGYFYNEWIYDKPGLTYRVSDTNSPYWAGLDYLLWPSELCAWVYNEPNASITIEITPLYPGKHSKKPYPISYEEWIKDHYKSLFKRTISREIAQQWIQQADAILKIIEHTAHYGPPS